MDKKIFEVEISNTGPKAYETDTVLALPCTQAEFHDALQKARITDDRHCRNELSEIRYPGITQDMIGQNVDLLELNLLAIRLTMLGEEDRMALDGLLRMEQKQHTGPIPLPHLINLTLNTDICMFVPQVSSYQGLGVLLYESEMLSDEAMTLLDTTEPESDYRKKLLEVFGWKYAEDYGGILTERGYVEPGGDFKEVYRKGEMSYFPQAGGVVALEVSRKYPDDPCSGSKPMALKLPALQQTIQSVLKQIGTASVEKCVFRCVDCEIPSLREAIDTSIKEDGIGQVNEFARLMEQKERIWHEEDFIKYKALLAAADSPSLRDAMQLADELDRYELIQDVAQPWDYAELILREKYPDLPGELFQTGQAARLGQKLLEESGSAITDYGLLRRKDGGQLPVCEQNSTQGMIKQAQRGGMEMM